MLLQNEEKKKMVSIALVKYLRKEVVPCSIHKGHELFQDWEGKEISRCCGIFHSLRIQIVRTVHPQQDEEIF